MIIEGIADLISEYVGGIVMEAIHHRIIDKAHEWKLRKKLDAEINTWIDNMDCSPDEIDIEGLCRYIALDVIKKVDLTGTREKRVFSRKIIINKAKKYAYSRRAKAYACEMVEKAIQSITEYCRENLVDVSTRIMGNEITDAIADQGEKIIRQGEETQRLIQRFQDMPNGPEIRDITRIIGKERKNIYLTTKAETEGEHYPGIQERFAKCSEVTLVNFAGTSFLSGEAVSEAYAKNELAKEWFYARLLAGKISCTVILNDPHSAAALDAAVHKMKPRKPKMPAHEIIAANINSVCRFKSEFEAKYPKMKLELRLTDVCLPYGVVVGDAANDDDDVMKVDLYSPLREYNSHVAGSGDDNRLSFYLTHGNEKTRGVWDRIMNAVAYVEEHSTVFEQPDIGWLTETGAKHVVHRGRYSPEHTGHNMNGFWECVRRGLPIEADIAELRDGTLVVGRGDAGFTLRSDPAVKKKLSDFTLAELREDPEAWEAKEAADSPLRPAEIMTLAEFLRMVSGQVPLVLELKLSAASSPEENEVPAKELTEKVLEDIRYYEGKYVIAAANPYALKAIREKDCTIPVGQITWEFSGLDNLPQYYLDMHRNLTFTDVVLPDVILQKYTEVMPRRDTDARKECPGRRLDVFGMDIPVVLWSNFRDSSAAYLDPNDMKALDGKVKNYILEARPDLY